MHLEQLHGEGFRVYIDRAQFGTHNIDREEFDSFDTPDFGGSSLELYKRMANEREVTAFQIFYTDRRDRIQDTQFYQALYIKAGKQWKLARVQNRFTYELVWTGRHNPPGGSYKISMNTRPEPESGLVTSEPAVATLEESRVPYLSWEEIEEPLKVHAEESSTLGLDTYRLTCPFGVSDLSRAFRGSDFEEAEEWGNGFRTVWINNTTLQIVTLVEGDLIIEDHRSANSFVDTIERAEEFYRSH